MTAILGISAFYHDSAAALVIDGRIVAAAQEERFTRVKNDARFPARAVAACLAQAGLSADQLDYVAFYDKPLAKFERLLETWFAYAPAGFGSFRLALPRWLKDKLHTPRAIRQGLGGCRAPLVFLEHHESHAASAFYPSPFAEAAVLTLDGVGEWSTTTLGIGRGNDLTLTDRLTFPHSLGLLYSAFTYYCGFKVNSGEYKLMGLAPYGKPAYQDLILDRIMDLRDDGSFRLDPRWFNYCQGLTMTNARFDALFGGPPRRPDSPLEQRHMDLAASIQAVTEEVVLRIGRHLHRQTGLNKLVLAGGVALNCVANGRLLREGPFDDIWVQPAAGDAGGALGAALFVWHQLLGKPREPVASDSQQASLLGPSFTVDEVEATLRVAGARYRRYDRESDLLADVSDLLARDKVVGWFQGRMEFGPRALGSRSILGDARSARMQAIMNLKIKFRESFRPFAPCVLREFAHEWFNVRPGADAPYMLQVAPVLGERRTPLSDDEQAVQDEHPDLVHRVNIVRSGIPAVTHIDYSARLQTVDERHGRYQRLLRAFHERTGCPVLVNTSFNLSWEPIVCTPAEAYQTFMQSEMDVLVLEDCVLLKEEQPLGLRPWAAPADAVPGANSPWADPNTGAPLLITLEAAVNPATGATYPVRDGVPQLLAGEPASGGGMPTADYRATDSPRALLEQYRARPFFRLLSEQLPYSARVLELGCGSGQLTNFLAIAHRSVLGVDESATALRLAQRFRDEHELRRATFGRTSLLRPALRPGFFDYVISHALAHPVQAAPLVHAAARLLRPGGCLILPGAASRRAAAGVLAAVGLEFVRRCALDCGTATQLFAPQRPRWTDRWRDIESVWIARRPLHGAVCNDAMANGAPRVAITEEINA